MFEKLIEKRLVSAIGAQVVDDSQSITIPVRIPEGLAEIVSITTPDYFNPGVPFNIDLHIVNNGDTDTLFYKLTNSDTGDVLSEGTANVPGGNIWGIAPVITLVQETAFHGLLEVGHIE